MIFINIIDRFYTFHLPFSCLIYHPSVIRHRSYRVENIHVNTKVDKRQSPCTLSVTSIKNIRIPVRRTVISYELFNFIFLIHFSIYIYIYRRYVIYLIQSLHIRLLWIYVSNYFSQLTFKGYLKILKFPSKYFQWQFLRIIKKTLMIEIKNFKLLEL